MPDVLRLIRKLNLKNLIIITRAWSLTITFISVTIANILVLRETRGQSLFLYLLTLVSACSLHAGANTLNDYFDTKNRIDSPSAPTAHYRPHPILALGLTPQKLLMLSLFLFGAAFSVGIILAIFRTAWLWPIIFFGFCAAIFYTGRPFNLKYIALGEPAVFFAFGPLMIEGSYAIQRQALSLNALFISLPIGLNVAVILLANNLRDADFDAKSGIKTLPTIMGQRKAFILYSALSALSYLFILVYFFCGIVKIPSLLVFLAVPKTIELIKDFSKEVPVDADARTSKVIFLYGLLFILGLFFEKFTK